MSKSTNTGVEIEGTVPQGWEEIEAGQEILTEVEVEEEEDEDEVEETETSGTARSQILELFEDGNETLNVRDTMEMIVWTGTVHAIRRIFRDLKKKGTVVVSEKMGRREIYKMAEAVTV